MDSGSNMANHGFFSVEPLPDSDTVGHEERKAKSRGPLGDLQDESVKIWG